MVLFEAFYKYNYYDLIRLIVNVSYMEGFMSSSLSVTSSLGLSPDVWGQDSQTVTAKSELPVYTEPLPYAIASLAIAVLGIGVALATAKLVVIVAGSIIAIIGASVFDQVMAYDHAHPKGSKMQPTIHKFMIYGVGGGIVKTILLITAITIKLLVVL